MAATKKPNGEAGQAKTPARPAEKRPAQARAGAAAGGAVRTPARRRRRFPGAVTRLLVLLLVMGAVAGMLYALLRLMGPGGQEQAAAMPTAVPTALPTATAPVPSPEPTPELPAVDINSWELRLVRYEYPLGEDYVPPKLVDIGDNEKMDSRVAPMIVQLIADARLAGNSVWVCSGYRDYATQHYIYFDNHVNVYMAQGMTEEEANAKARLAVNYPGTSEHQYGLSVDILESSSQPMEPYIGGSGLMLWLEEHCAEYGFVVRYPDGKTDITGVEYEPWHLRYVGQEAAAYMMEHNLCLEEFLDLYQF